MPANFQNLQSQIDQLVQQVDQTKSVEASAKTLIENFAQRMTEAVTQALQADDAADNGSIEAASAAIQNVKTQFADSANQLGAAVANTSGTGGGGGGTEGSPSRR